MGLGDIFSPLPFPGFPGLSWALLGHIWGLLGFPRLSWVLPGSPRFPCIFQVFLGSPELSWSLLDFLSFLELSWALSGFPGAFLGSRRLSWILGLYLGSKRKASEASEGLRTGSSAQGEYEQYCLITVWNFPRINFQLQLQCPQLQYEKVLELIYDYSFSKGGASNYLAITVTERLLQIIILVILENAQ